MTTTWIIASVLSFQSAGAATAQDAADAQDTGTVAVVEADKPKKITDRNHPDYVRCRSESVIGSRAKRKRTCMTNKEWALVSRRGNEASRDFMADNQNGFMAEKIMKDN